MQSARKNVFYVKYLPDDVFIDVLKKTPGVELTKLENESPDVTANPVLQAAHGYQVGATRSELAKQFHVTPDLIARCPNLLVVSSNGAGYDTVDVEACTEAGILVLNQAGGNAQSVAEHALGMILSLSKRIVQVDKALRRGGLKDRTAFKGAEVQGKTIGIVGLGHVGKRLAAMCQAALNMKVLACDPYLTDAQIAAQGATKVDLDTLLTSSDFVSICCPLTSETRKMFGAAQFAKMKPHAIFITTARGFIHDEMALAQALRDGKILAAGLDVWEDEPPPPDHPLMALDNVVVSPHTAGVTHDARIRMATIAADQLGRTLSGERPQRIVNPEVWPRYAERFAKAFGRAPAGAASGK
jgi:D-3-phosphoglycerate dehydrogenase / 2-oxoglutarate reductase